jgi:uncharacterized protein
MAKSDAKFLDLKSKLIPIARDLYSNDDPSHDFQHILRVLGNIELLSQTEGGDIEILIPAALFHDVVNYPKNDPKAVLATNESADKAAAVLKQIKDYPTAKIEKVMHAISVCSFSKNIKAETLEAQLLQDADMLEATGAISIMRTFASAGNMKRRFYDPEDPYAKSRILDPRENTLDLFYVRLLRIPERMNTKLGKQLAEQRMKILHEFLTQLNEELMTLYHS